MRLGATLGATFYFKRLVSPIHRVLRGLFGRRRLHHQAKRAAPSGVALFAWPVDSSGIESASGTDGERVVSRRMRRAARTTSACRRERALQGRFPPASGKPSNPRSPAPTLAARQLSRPAHFSDCASRCSWNTWAIGVSCLPLRRTTCQTDSIGKPATSSTDTPCSAAWP